MNILRKVYAFFGGVFIGIYLTSPYELPWWWIAIGILFVIMGLISDESGKGNSYKPIPPTEPPGGMPPPPHLPRYRGDEDD